jgi:uncharacterized membrane protein
MRPPRLAVVDLARGVAIVSMVVYHAAWFSLEAGLHEANLRAPGWVWFQRSIAATFFFLVGCSLVLATIGGLNRQRYLVRLGKLAACAAVVTVTSLVLAPSRVVSFGILHSILLASIVVLPLAQRPRLAGGLAVVGACLFATVSSTAFDTRALAWIGLGTRIPPTLDHQPVLPWFVVVLVGVVGGHLLLKATPLHGGVKGPLRGLQLLGRYSLELYMVHVPVLIAIVVALVLLGAAGA